MNKLFVRLVATGAVFAGLGAPAVMADSATIGVTGPGSTNVITSSNLNSFMQRTRNQVDTSNWNFQTARSGNVLVAGNTKVSGNGLGSGNAANWNAGVNNVSIDNSGGGGANWGAGGGGRDGSIFLTGPGSFNKIGSNDSNRVNDTTVNNVNANNYSSQTARSGDVKVVGNTVVEGVGGSGNAVNENEGVNTVNIDNQGNATPGWMTSGGGSANIGVTGPFSNNQIRGNDSSRFNQTTVNDVNATNVNHQTATTGNVTIAGNTVVSGVGGSGSAFNSNMGQNDVGIGNN